MAEVPYHRQVTAESYRHHFRSRVAAINFFMTLSDSLHTITDARVLKHRSTKGSWQPIEERRQHAEPSAFFKGVSGLPGYPCDNSVAA